ncbi:ABC transporter permease [Bacteroidota bacterium]
MILHYIKMTFRNLVKDLMNSIINLVGLTLALSCAFLILLFVLNELSTDGFHAKKDTIYRTYIKFKSGDEERAYNSTSLIFAENITTAFPEIANITRMYSYDHFYGGQYIHFNDELIRSERFFIVDQAFFNIFSFKVLLGDKNNLIQNMQSLVLTERMAEKFFANENPIGKSLTIEDTRGNHEFIVTGVIENFPSNSSIQANFLGNIELASEHIRYRGWGISATSTFISFKSKINKADFEEKLNQFGKEHHPDQSYTYALQSLSDIYFHSDFFSYYRFYQGNYRTISIYSLIGLIILLIVSINYIILNIGKSSQRLTEIGVKKVLGASRKSMLQQILIESILFTFIAFPLAIMVSELVLPYFNIIMGKEFNLNYSQNFTYILGMFLLTVFVGLISGSYISVYLLAFNPDQIFKRRFSSKQEKINIKKILIIFQLLAFIILVVFSFISAQQVKYMSNVDQGYNEEKLIAIHPPHDHSLTSCRNYVDEILKNPSISNASEVLSGLYTPASSLDNYMIPGTENEIEFSLLKADFNYIPTMEIKLKSGRNFYQDSKADSLSIIINSTAARLFGKETPVGSSIKSVSGKTYNIIGVVDDFYVKSLHSAIPPLGILLKDSDEMVSQIIVRVNGNNYAEALSFLQNSWNEFGPKNSKFEYDFFEDILSTSYTNDSNFSKTINIFTIIAILIASLGVFGFSFYNAKRRTKEIGIRKVFGGTPKNIITLFSKELLVLVLIANIIAIPISYILTEKWLNNYAFHIQTPVWVFLITIVLSMIIVLISSGISILNAAKRNPTVSLRYE